MSKPDLEQYADQRDQAKYEENQAIARTARTLRAELAKAKDDITSARAETATTEKALSLYDHVYAARPEWLLPPKDPKPGRATLLGELSDIHTGEVVRPSEIDGYNKFDLRICEMRLERFFRRSIETARSWTGYRYDGAVLPMLGDGISGGIHDELRETDECSPYEAALWLVPRLAAGIELWRKEFKRVHVCSAPGNHGRDSKLPRYKKRSAHNLDTLVARLVARELKSVEGVTFEIPDSLDASFKVYDWDFSLAHGEELARKFSGTAEIGVLGPLMRGTNRKKNALAKQGRILHYALWGHFHQYIPVPSRGFIANGSVKGYDEYAKGLVLQPEPPQQALMVIEPEHGVTAQSPVLLLDRAAEKW